MLRDQKATAEDLYAEYERLALYADNTPRDFTGDPIARSIKLRCEMDAILDQALDAELYPNDLRPMPVTSLTPDQPRPWWWRLLERLGDPQ